MKTKTSNDKVCIIIPVYNGESTISDTLNSLANQYRPSYQVVIIDDHSSDNSVLIIKDFLKSHPKITGRLITHPKSAGLAANYNEGIKNTNANLIVTMHQDIILKKNALDKLLAPLKEDVSVVATSHTVDHPIDIWRQYSFWQKCLFSRLVGKRFSGIDGKFDGFRKSALIKVGTFDRFTFRTAGEDGDILFRLKKIGKIVKTKAEIIHVHQANQLFGIKQYLKKHAQYAEAQGVLYRKHDLGNIKEFIRSFFREILVLSLLVPYFNQLGLALILIYSIVYTQKVYQECHTNPRILLLPFVNIYLLFISTYYSLRGYVTQKQIV